MNAFKINKDRPEIIRELDYKINNKNCAECSNSECKEMRKQLEYYSNLLHETSFQETEELKVFSSPEKSSIFEYDDLSTKVPESNRSKINDFKFISNNSSFYNAESPTSSTINYQQQTLLRKQSNSSYRIGDLINRRNLENNLKSKQNDNYVNDFNKKRHELETTI